MVISEAGGNNNSSTGPESELIHGLTDKVKKLEAELIVSEARVSALMSFSHNLVFRVVISDGEGNIIRQKGFADPALENGGSGDRVGEAVHSVLRRSLTASIAVEHSVQLPGPPIRMVLINAMPIVVDDVAIGAVALVRDANESNSQDLGRRDFVANLSHELKTPIGALGLLAETILMEHEPEITQRLVRRMHAESIRVGQVIDDLLQLSRLEAAGSAEFVSLSARSIVESAINRVRYTAEHRHIAIAVSGDISATVYGTDTELVSAVHHLIENGLKYSSDNSSIEVSVTTDQDWTEISVADHGVGIAPQYLDRIFERFYRVDDARTRATGGTGLGLSIVHRVARNHGGEVQVTSEEGKGSTFKLRLAARSSQDGAGTSGGNNG